METLSNSDKLQLEMAAKGCVSGTLAEWPWLLGAFRRAGVHASAFWSAHRASVEARKLLGLPESYLENERRRLQGMMAS